MKAKDEAGNADPTLASLSFTVSLGRDLVEVFLTNPPATAKRGTKFKVTDTAKNQGGIATKTSTTRYYLSADWTADRRLTGSHSVPPLAPGATYPKTVTIPSNTLTGVYHLLACVDDTGRVAESIEANNCLSSATTVQVTP